MYSNVKSNTTMVMIREPRYSSIYGREKLKVESPQVNVAHAKKLISEGFSKDLINKDVQYLQNLFVKLKDEEAKALREGVDTRGKPFTQQGFVIHNLGDAINNVLKIKKQKLEAQKQKEPRQMTYREFADYFQDVWGGQKFTFTERVGKPLGIQSQAGEPYHMIQGRRIGYSGSLDRDRWRLAIVDKALSEGKEVPEDVLAELSESLKHEKEKLGETGMAEQYEENPPGPEVKDWMKRALGIEDYKGGRHDRIQMLSLLIQNSELGNIRSISEAGSMALALGKDLGYGIPPAYGKSRERYYAEKIAAETGKEVHIIKSSDIIKPPAKITPPVPPVGLIPAIKTVVPKKEIVGQPQSTRMLKEILNKAIREGMDLAEVSVENNIPSTIVAGMTNYKTFGEKGIDWTYRQMNQGHKDAVDKWLAEMNHPLSKSTSTQEYRFRAIVKELFIPDQTTLAGTKAPSPEEIKRQYTLKLQLARSFDELQPIKNEIPFLPLSQADKNQLIDVFNKRYEILIRQLPFGIHIPPKQQEKPRILGAPTPQQRFEEEQRRKAAEKRRTPGQKTLTSASSKRLSEFGIKEPMLRYHR